MISNDLMKFAIPLDEGSDSNISNQDIPNKNFVPDNDLIKFAIPLQEEKKQPESTEQALLRHSTRTGSRVAETVAGLPGDVSDFIQSILNFGYEKISGKKAPVENIEKLQQVSGRKTPSSEELKNISQEFTGGYTKPRGYGEELGDKITQDFTSLLIPIKGKIPFVRSLGTAIASNLGSDAVKLFGGSEKAQGLTKLGTTFIGMGINPNGAKKYVDSLYATADRILPQEAKVSAKSLIDELTPLKKQLKKGLEAPSEETVLKQISKLEDKVKDGMIGLDELTASKRSLNEIMGDPALLKRGRTLLTDVHKSLSSSIRQAEKEYPEFVKNYLAADQGYAGIQQSKKVSRFLKNNIKHLKYTSPVGALFGFHNPKAFVAGVAGATAGLGILKAGELMHRIGNNPTLRRYYLNTINNSLKGNSAGAIRNFNQLSDKIENEK